MGWDLVKLNDGHTMPTIAFGTWKIGNGQGPIDQVDQALNVGFSHVDTAQVYGNEVEAGKAFHQSGLAREDVFITTKYSGLKDIETSIQDSLDNLGVKYVDLYLIHSPRLAVPDIPTVWAKMEKIKKDGLAKSIGVSNFNVDELKTLLASATVKPVANQILLHPYVFTQQAPILEYAAEQDIVIEAYSALIPLTQRPGGPVDTPVRDISTRLGIEPEQVLLAWVKAKGAVAVTTSSKKDRLQRYLDAGDLKLSATDIVAIDAAGAVGARRDAFRSAAKRVALVGVVGTLAWWGMGRMGCGI